MEALETLPLTVFARTGRAARPHRMLLTDGIGLRHPLLRSLVLMRTPLAAKVSAYRALSEAADVTAVRGTSRRLRSALTTQLPAR